MAVPQRHIIGTKQFLVRAEDENNARRWMQMIAERVNNADFLDRLSRRLDELVPANLLIRVGTLEVTIDLDENNFEEQLIALIEESLQPYLIPKKNQDPGPTIQGNLEAIIHFLSFGYYPWWVEHARMNGAIEQFSDKELAKILGLLQGRPEAIIRFARLVSVEFLGKKFVPGKLPHKELLAIIRFFEQAFNTLLDYHERKSQFLIKVALTETVMLNMDQPNSFTRALINRLLGKLSYKQIRVFQNWYEQFAGLLTDSLEPVEADGKSREYQDRLSLAKTFVVLPNSVKRRVYLSLRKTDSHKPQKPASGFDDTDNQPAFDDFTDEYKAETRQGNNAGKQKESTTNKSDEAMNLALREEGIFLPNAGLILLHPFLPKLFESMALLEGDAFIDEKSQLRAIQMLGWLATGNDGLPEEELGIAKLLTGYPLSAALEASEPLSESDIQVGNDLLRAVIGHWTAIGNTSEDGLRQSFLIRKGKLVLEERGFRLLVEQKTLDILLDRLPWGIGIAKPPWCEQPIFTEWA